MWWARLLNVISGLLSGGAAPAAATSYESIQTVSLSGSQATVSFTSIPSTYKHLQVRLIAKTDRALNRDGIKVTYNSDTSTSYVSHYLYGDGATAGAGYDYAAAFAGIYRAAGNSSATNTFGAIVYDILDYANTNKNKTGRYLGGLDVNGAGEMYLGSTLFLKTDVISSITFAPSVGTNFLQYSSFALYGIKG